MTKKTLSKNDRYKLNAVCNELNMISMQIVNKSCQVALLQQAPLVKVVLVQINEGKCL